MSGSFEDLDVPPGLIAFAVDTVDVEHVISRNLKKLAVSLYISNLNGMSMSCRGLIYSKKNCSCISQLIRQGKVLSAQTVRNGGIAAAVSKMAFGNKIGLHLTASIDSGTLFTLGLRSFLLEISGVEGIDALFKGIEHQVLVHYV